MGGRNGDAPLERRSSVEAKVSVRELDVVIPIGPGVTVEGQAAVPAGARGRVLFVHGSGCSRLFEEPGALEEVARHAAGWFARHL